MRLESKVPTVFFTLYRRCEGERAGANETGVRLLQRSDDPECRRVCGSWTLRFEEALRVPTPGNVALWGI